MHTFLLNRFNLIKTKNEKGYYKDPELNDY